MEMMQLKHIFANLSYLLLLSDSVKRMLAFAGAVLGPAGIWACGRCCRVPEYDCLCYGIQLFVWSLLLSLRLMGSCPGFYGEVGLRQH